MRLVVVLCRRRHLVALVGTQHHRLPSTAFSAFSSMEGRSTNGPTFGSLLKWDKRRSATSTTSDNKTNLELGAPHSTRTGDGGSPLARWPARAK